MLLSPHKDHLWVFVLLCAWWFIVLLDSASLHSPAKPRLDSDAMISFEFSSFNVKRNRSEVWISHWNLIFSYYLTAEIDGLKLNWYTPRVDIKKYFLARQVFPRIQFPTFMFLHLTKYSVGFHQKLINTPRVDAVQRKQKVFHSASSVKRDELISEWEQS